VTTSADQPATPNTTNRSTRPGGLRRFIGLGLVVVFGILGFAAALVYDQVSPHLYASDAVIRVYNPYRLSGSQFGQVDPITITSLELQYAKSKVMEDAAKDALEDVDYTEVDWTAQPAAATLTVKCFTEHAQDSTKCAKTFADVYTQRRSDEIAAPLEKQIDELGQKIDQLTQKVKVLQAKIKAQPGPEGKPTDANRGRLSQQTALLEQISDLSQAQQTAHNQAATVAQNYEVVSEPTIPSELAKPTTARNLAIGTVAGLLLGLLLVLVLARYRSPAPTA
jgi:uncharacterized protein involved in exopolysaccharide biosynthesis